MIGLHSTVKRSGGVSGAAAIVIDIMSGAADAACKGMINKNQMLCPFWSGRQ